jgi:hypothetical protein
MPEETTIGSGIIECHSLQEVLGGYRHKSFVLTEESDDFLVLYHERDEIGRFYQFNPFIKKEFIWEECQRHLLAHLKAGNK